MRAIPSITDSFVAARRGALEPATVKSSALKRGAGLCPGEQQQPPPAAWSSCRGLGTASSRSASPAPCGNAAPLAAAPPVSNLYRLRKAWLGVLGTFRRPYSGSCPAAGWLRAGPGSAVPGGGGAEGAPREAPAPQQPRSGCGRRATAARCRCSRSHPRGTHAAGA